MISVIIPCYNSEEYIERAIKSVLKQSYKDYEIILIDNGSTDNTTSILHDYQKRYPNLIKVFYEHKRGGAAARNKGLHEAKGEWIQFLDSDDELLPAKLGSQIQIANGSDIDIVIGNYYKHIFYKGVQLKKTYQADVENVWRGLFTTRLGITSSNLWRKDAVLKVNGWDESKTSSQEYDLLFRMLKIKEQVGFSRQPLTIIHDRKNSVHKSENKERLIEIINNYVNLRMEIKKYLKQNDQLTDKLERQTNTYLYSYLMLYNPIVPSYIERTLAELKLDLPLSSLLKRYIRKTKCKLEQHIRVVFSSKKSIV